MGRMSGGETIIVRPTNNIYTVLVGAAVVVEIVGLILLIMQAKTLLGGSGLF